MREIIIVVLLVLVIWLFIERNRLTEELATSATQVSEAQTRSEQLERQVATLRGPAGAPGAAQKSWLDEHIQRGAKALETAPVRGDNRR